MEEGQPQRRARAGHTQRGRARPRTPATLVQGACPSVRAANTVPPTESLNDSFIFSCFWGPEGQGLGVAGGVLGLPLVCEAAPSLGRTSLTSAVGVPAGPSPTRPLSWTGPGPRSLTLCKDRTRVAALGGPGVEASTHGCGEMIQPQAEAHPWATREPRQRLSTSGQ